MLPCCPVALEPVRLPGVLLNVKERSAIAWPTSRIVLALIRFANWMLIWPGDVMKVALADNVPSLELAGTELNVMVEA